MHTVSQKSIHTLHEFHLQFHYFDSKRIISKIIYTDMKNICKSVIDVLRIHVYCFRKL